VNSEKVYCTTVETFCERILFSVAYLISLDVHLLQIAQSV
jgi:hypothetical protein